MRTKHLPALDGLRGIAVLIVMGSHVSNAEVIPGAYGVTLFFFISGFIITKMMLEQSFSAEHFKAFYVRRVFRLAPALLTFMVFSGFAFGAMGYAIPLADFMATLLYYANYHGFAPLAGMSSPLELTWSLAVEEHFYFVFPIIFLLTRKRQLVQALLALTLIVLLWRATAVFELGIYKTQIARHTDTRIDSIVWGCLLSALIHSKSRILPQLGSSRMLLFAVVVSVLDLAIRNQEYRETLRYSIQGAVLLVIFCNLFWSHEAPQWLQSVLSSGVLQFFGRISYSLYLYHYAILVFCKTFLPHGLVALSCAVVGGISAATLSYKFVETPFRRFGSRLAQSMERKRLASQRANTGA